MGPPAFWYKVLIHMTVGTTFPCKILNNGKEPCEPLMTSSYAYHSGLRPQIPISGLRAPSQALEPIRCQFRVTFAHKSFCCLGALSPLEPSSIPGRPPSGLRAPLSDISQA